MDLEPERTSMMSTCVNCVAGQADDDGDSTTPCVQCDVGFYAAEGSASCESCATTGTIDHDDDASTPCIANNGQCFQECAPGTEDADCDDTTPCTECTLGRFSSGGFYLEFTSSQCRQCAPGSFAPHGAITELDECEACPLGRADDDTNAWTECQECTLGRVAANGADEVVLLNATQCMRCTPGKFASNNVSTPCTLCPLGRANPHVGSTNASACAPCAVGHWSYDAGTASCPMCPEGSYRGMEDGEGCVACDTSMGHICERGAGYPRAAGGYYAQIEQTQTGGEATAVVLACNPFPFACLGTCPMHIRESILAGDSFADSEDSNLGECGAGEGEESCTLGYGKPLKIRLCTPNIL